MEMEWIEIKDLEQLTLMESPKAVQCVDAKHLELVRSNMRISADNPGCDASIEIRFGVEGDAWRLEAFRGGQSVALYRRQVDDASLAHLQVSLRRALVLLGHAVKV